MTLSVTREPDWDHPVTRFAPSPNGYLHLGHAYSAIRNLAYATTRSGAVLLRIEDIDRTRCRPEYEDSIFEDLAWLGFSWAKPVLRQSERGDPYRHALAQLDAAGVLYPCFCTRGDIARRAGQGGWPRDPDGAPLYPGTCKELSPSARAAMSASGRRPSYRLDMIKALASVSPDLSWIEFGETELGRCCPAKADRWGDAVVAGREFGTSYHLAVVVDDAAQGVTDVVRGDDLKPATHLHRLLQALLGLPTPRYRHHRLVLDEAGRKFSKSAKSRSLRELREAGWSPELIRRDLLLQSAMSSGPITRSD